MGAVGPLILLFSLAGGFAFLQLCHFFKHRWDSLEWERNLFEAALVGGVLFFSVRLTVPPFENVEPFHSIKQLIRHAAPFPFAGSFAGALLLGGLAALGVNRFYPRERAIRRAVERHSGELLILLQDAGRHALPVSLTMSNRKVYIGFIMAPPSPKYRYTKILPTMSGHRDASTLHVTLDTEYWRVYEDLRRRRSKGEIVGVKEDDFGIVLPVDQICSANLFDNDTYRRYFRPEDAASAVQANLPTD